MYFQLEYKGTMNAQKVPSDMIMIWLDWFSVYIQGRGLLSFGFRFEEVPGPGAKSSY